jgi:hypothetical protein
MQARLVVVDEDAGGDMHGADENHSFFDLAVAAKGRYLIGEPHQLPPEGSIQGQIFRI